ncbi:MAG TPA: Hpt domain-containing protein [Acidobacteriota bacterium]|nr:Hpt domain-containing protein [Acidobacteriota bacterium]
MQQESGLEQRLREIRRKFEESLPGKAERIEDLWRGLQTGWNEELAKSLYAEVHRLHGSCGTLGFGPVSDVAREIQTLIREAMERQSLPDAGVCVRITELVGILSGNCGCRESPQDLDP